MGLAALSLALAFGQLAVGLAQPVVGALADRFGAIRVILAGAVVLAFTTALPAIDQLPWVICSALTASAVAGSAVGSNGVLVGEVSRCVPPGRAGLAVGLIGAGGSVGQLVLGPATHWAIERLGWSGALLATAALCLVALPLAIPFPAGRRRPRGRSAHWPQRARQAAHCGKRISGASPQASRSAASMWPSSMSTCRVSSNAAGSPPPPWPGPGSRSRAPPISRAASPPGWRSSDSTAAGCWLGIYAVRAAGILALLLLTGLAPAMLGFATVMGASYMATLPPTAQLVSLSGMAPPGSECFSA